MAVQGGAVEYLLVGKDELSGILKEATEAAGKLSDAEDKTSRKTESMTKSMIKANVILGGLKMAARAAANAFKEIAVGAITVGANVEALGTRLGSLMGSTEAAQVRLEELVIFGATTPFELQDLFEAEINLRALGVSAEETLPLIMDFAGAMGKDLPGAAVEVGRAMQFGAGAVETVAGRALRAQVEIRTGTDALKMSTEEFRGELIKTLTDPEGIFAGGTEKLAATFQGMLSNLADAWFGFQKDIAEAGAFDTAKMVLADILELLGKNRQSTKEWAKDLSGGLVEAILGAYQAIGLFHDVTILIRMAWLSMEQLFMGYILAFTMARQGILMVLNLIPGTEGTSVDQALIDTEREVASLEKMIRENQKLKEDLQDQGGLWGEIRERTKKIREDLAAAAASASTVGGGGGRRGGGTGTGDEEGAGKAPPEPSPVSTMTRIEVLLSMLGNAAERWSDEANAHREKMLQGIERTANTANGVLMGQMPAFGGWWGAIIQLLLTIGREGADKIGENIDGMRDDVIAIPKELGLLLGEELPAAIAKGLGGTFIKELAENLDDILVGLLIKLPEALTMVGPILIMNMAEAFLIAGQEIVTRFFSFKAGETAQGSGITSTADAWQALRDTFLEGPRGRGFQSGTAFVDRTGLALLHRGEEVVPAGGVGRSPTRGIRGGAGPAGGVHLTINAPFGMTPGSAEHIVRELNKILGARGLGLSLG